MSVSPTFINARIRCLQLYRVEIKLTSRRLS